MTGADGDFAVLLVEDDEGMVGLVEQYLAGQPPGWRVGRADVEPVGTLAGALERLEGGTYDVVLLDLGLPETRGLQTLDRVVAARDDLPVVVLTGIDDSETAVRAIQEGAQDFLLKGDIDGGRLWRAMRYAVERKRVERALRRHNERLETFATHVEDELSEPLGVARRRLASAEDGRDDGGGDAGEDDLAALRSALDRVEALVGEVLDLADEMRSIEDPELVDLEAAVDRAWRIARTETAALRVTGGLGTVMAEDARLVELLDAIFRALLSGGGERLLEVGGLDASHGLYVADLTRAGPDGAATAPPDGDRDLAQARDLAEALAVAVEVVERSAGPRVEVYGFQPG